MTVKRSHMVSKSYIRAWADTRGRVEVLDLQHGRGFVSSVENATVVSYAYDASIMAQNLEGHYAGIEDRGIPALAKLRTGGPLAPAEQTAMINFLDLHLDRGRYADQANTRIPAVLINTDGRSEAAGLTLGDRLLLSQFLPDVIRLTSLGLEQWPWHVYEARDRLATGDGAVLLWQETQNAEISTISFPLSPTQMLVIGKDLPDALPLPPNALLAKNSKRWIVGALGTLNRNQAAVIAARRSEGAI